ncbi:hypothetical protein EVAR_38694_1 [Eumeta japonica]|uniref:Uncharacterized protein n=1 Tax=Eumeta variegata TaxID=151549 RepID=A0A4C1XPN4_EUMVA|nr:hypothetical protein EVAR_38694_1 [Eumeta japonica]
MRNGKGSVFLSYLSAVTRGLPQGFMGRSCCGAAAVPTRGQPGIGRRVPINRASTAALHPIALHDLQRSHAFIGAL